jgi:hypothetical protein
LYKDVILEPLFYNSILFSAAYFEKDFIKVLINNLIKGFGCYR